MSITVRNEHDSAENLWLLLIIMKLPLVILLLWLHYYIFDLEILVNIIVAVYQEPLLCELRVLQSSLIQKI